MRHQRHAFYDAVDNFFYEFYTPSFDTIIAMRFKAYHRASSTTQCDICACCEQITLEADLDVLPEFDFWELDEPDFEQDDLLCPDCRAQFTKEIVHSVFDMNLGGYDD